MKKNITINLCGRLFQIDEDAYELLQQYIESLRSYFGRGVKRAATKSLTTLRPVSQNCLTNSVSRASRLSPSTT